MSVVLEASLEERKMRKYFFLSSSSSSPSNVERDEGDTDSHDDEERLEGNVVTDGLESHPLHHGHVVVLLQQI